MKGREGERERENEGEIMDRAERGRCEAQEQIGWRYEKKIGKVIVRFKSHSTNIRTSILSRD